MIISEEIKPKSKRGGARKGAGRKSLESKLYPESNLTLKQKLFVKSRVEGKTIKESAKIAGYSPTSKVVGKGLHVQTEFQRLLAQVVPDAYLVGKLRAGLSATKKTYAADKFGVFSDERRDPDYATQFKFVELASKIKNVIPKDQEKERPAVQVEIKVLGVSSDIQVNTISGGSEVAGEVIDVKSNGISEDNST